MKSENNLHPLTSAGFLFALTITGCTLAVLYGAGQLIEPLAALFDRTAIEFQQWVANSTGFH